MIARHNTVFSRGAVIAGLLTFFTIEGPLVSFIILPGHFKPDDVNFESTAEFLFLKDYLGPNLRRKWDHYLVFTQKGFMNNDAFLQCLKKTINIWNQKNPGLQALFIGDNLESHRTTEVLMEFARSQHLSWYIPAKTSNILAMPDDIPFRDLKRDAEREIERSMWDSMLTNANCRWDICTAYLETELNVFTPEICTKAFNNCGIVDDNGNFNREIVLQRIKDNLGPFEAEPEEFVEKVRVATSTIIENAQLHVKKKVK